MNSGRERCYVRLRTLLQSCPLRRRLRAGPVVQPVTTAGGVTSSGGLVVAVNSMLPEEGTDKCHQPVPSTEASPDPDDDRMCRYCFEGDEAGELISPCKCTGGQKYVHLTCLRMWQRAVLISQPTHPDFYTSDSRQRVCNVCKSTFTCRPPTRMELMAWMTGPEIAALIEEGCIIGSAEDFSCELENQIAGLPPMVQNHGLVCRNWIRGIFLIVKVVQDRDTDERLLRLTDQEDVSAFLEKLDEDAETIYLRGRKYKVSLFNTSLLESNGRETTPQERRAAIRALQAPVTVKLRLDAEQDCGEDGVVAVNLTRKLYLDDPTCPPPYVYNIRDKVAAAGGNPELLSGSDGDCSPTHPVFQVQHFIGGPCEEAEVGATIVVNSTTKKHYVMSGARCLERAFTLAREEATDISGISKIEHGISSTSTTASSADFALDSEPAIKRQRITEDQDDAAYEEPPEMDSETTDTTKGCNVHVMVFWGYAGWSRCQLMGEIARGSWGMCESEDADVLSLGGPHLWKKVYPRMIFAPKNEMSETYNREAPAEEDRQRQLRRMSLFQLFLRNNGPGGRRGRGANLRIMPQQEQAGAPDAYDNENENENQHENYDEEEQENEEEEQLYEEENGMVDEQLAMMEDEVMADLGE